MGWSESRDGRNLPQLVRADALQRRLRGHVQPGELDRRAAIGVNCVAARAVADELLHGGGRALPRRQVQRRVPAVVGGGGAAAVEQERLADRAVRTAADRIAWGGAGREGG